MGAMTQLDMTALWAPDLPDAEELTRRFIRFNARYFDNKLPRATVRWSKRMRIAGTCDRGRRVITLSWAYHQHFPDDVDDTLLHEMIHLRLPHHDAAFRREAERVGATVHCKEYPGLHPRARYVYICPNCQAVFHRTRRDRLYCGRCARYRLDSRYILVLRSSTQTLAKDRSLAAKKPASRRTRRRRRPKVRDTHELF
ncbi:MAG: hypothetical protein Kow0074_03120 [Candidatus Zixiibacteriota bacterium]